MRIGLIQMACGTDKSINLNRSLSLVEKAAEQGAEVICFQELFSTRYFCQTESLENWDLAEPLDGPTVTRMREAAADLKVSLIVPFFERRMGGVYANSAAVINPGGKVLGVYRKMHIPDDPGFQEKFYFTPGDLGFRTWDLPSGRIGVCICWDQWFPEAARATALRGAEVIFYPTAIGWIPEDEGLREKQWETWEVMQRSHAIANGCYVAAVNRTGLEVLPEGEDGIHFWGRSFLAGPDGHLIAQAGEDEQVLVADTSRETMEEQRRMWPFFRDRRVDAYGDLLQQTIS